MFHRKPRFTGPLIGPTPKGRRVQGICYTQLHDMRLMHIEAYLTPQNRGSSSAHSPRSKPNMSQNTEAERKCLFQGHRRFLTRLRYPW